MERALQGAVEAGDDARVAELSQQVAALEQALAGSKASRETAIMAQLNKRNEQINVKVGEWAVWRAGGATTPPIPLHPSPSNPRPAEQEACWWEWAAQRAAARFVLVGGAANVAACSSVEMWVTTQNSARAALPPPWLGPRTPGSLVIPWI